MKKKISVLLLLLMIMSLTLCGCKDKKKNDYVVNNDGVVNIGVLLPLSGDFKDLGEKVSDGIDFASMLAPSVNIDNGEPYKLNLIYKDIENNIEEICDEFRRENVAAVICAGTDKDTTDSVISEFKNDSTALIFTDCNSSQVIASPNTLSLSIPSSYQVSVAATYFNEQGLKSGAVVASGDDYGKSVAKLFKDQFVSKGGSSVSEYYYDCENANFNANTIAGAELEFVFLVGNQQKTMELYRELKSAESDLPVILSEVLDQTPLESKEFNNIVYISKFERDDNNYIGTDFLKNYSVMNNESNSEVTTATAYGYDAYMLIYGALTSFNSNLNSVSADGSDVTTNNTDSDEIMASQVLSALISTPHMGVTDYMKFTENGLLNTKFLYLSTIRNSNASMLNKYNYNYEIE